MGDELVVRFRSGAAAVGAAPPSFSIGLDVLGGQLAYISHAHSDHSEAVGGPLPIFCSDVTATLLGLGEAKKQPEGQDGENGAGLPLASGRNGANPSGDETGMAGDGAKKTAPVPALAGKEPYFVGARGRRRKTAGGGARIPVPEGIELRPAGHILGATQIVGDSPIHGRLAYTGDFKLRDGLTVKGADIVPCDTLVAECTYGDPTVSFPPAEETWNDMERWSRQNQDCIQLWGGYSTGKAQEIVKFLNDYLDIEPVVSGRLAQVCAAYGAHGVKLRYLEAEKAEAQEAMRGPFSAVLPPHVLTPQLAGRIGAAHRRKALTALATGWALVRPLSCSAAFPISDHADFSQLLEYAAGCGAKTVYLAHGENEKTARALRAAGYNALAIGEMAGRQMVLEME